MTNESDFESFAQTAMLGLFPELSPKDALTKLVCERQTLLVYVERAMREMNPTMRELLRADMIADGLPVSRRK